jgi:biopolymer transport protein ExbB
MWALIIERLWVGRALQRADLGVAEAVQAIRSGTSPAEARGIRARLVRRFLAARTGVTDLDRHILRQCGMQERLELARSLSSISVLATVAPLLGLLGTVIGMIETFNVISVFGTGNAKAMAHGISVALITTETGLLVAIPGVFLAAMLWRRSKRLKAQIEEDLTILDRVVRRTADQEV